MSYVPVSNYCPGLVPGLMNAQPFLQDDKESYLEELMNGVDEINKQDVMNRMQQFSCKEEMERYVEKKELPRFM